ncbi:MAG: hypothetical protein K1X94_11285 [Sandaracinaceae bacterium]|nr:hypothetical protein [Sandaracinaceae bacterium]
MMSARAWLVPALVTAGAATVIASACSVGTGEGEITGSLVLRDCNVDLPDYSLRPPGAVDGEESPTVTIRVQRGSFRESFSDGLMVSVYDVDEVARAHLEEPLPLTPIDETRTRLVDVTFYAGQSCDSGYPDEFWRTPGLLHAVSGTITFHALHAPDLDGADTEISAELTDVQFEASGAAADKHAHLDGWFRFFYQRGAPSQSFP